MITNIEFREKMEELIKKMDPSYVKSLDKTVDDYESLNYANFKKEFDALIENYTGGGGASSADAVSYDNTDSGLEATDVQDAIDELAGGVTPVDVVPDLVISGEFEENLNTDAYAGFSYTFKSGITIEDIITKIQNKGYIDIASRIYSDVYASVIGVRIHPTLFCNQKFSLISVSPEAAEQALYALTEQHNLTTKNCVVLAITAGGYQWDSSTSSGRLSLNETWLAIYEDVNGDIAIIKNAQIPV